MSIKEDVMLIIDNIAPMVERFLKNADHFRGFTLEQRNRIREKSKSILSAFEYTKQSLDQDDEDLGFFLRFVGAVGTAGQLQAEVLKGITFSRLKRDHARLRLENDPKQDEKKFIYICWREWQDQPERYKSKAAFSRDMLTKCEHLTSQKKIEDWCRDWEKANPAG